MTTDVLKDFLISLGFRIDESGADRFARTVEATTLKVVKMGVAVQAAALAVVGYTTKIASGLDELYFSAQRTGSTVEGIKAIGYAAAQAGSSASAAQSSLSNLARFIRNSPGAEGYLQRLGVQTRDAQGRALSTEAIFTGLGKRLNQMPVYRANQYAQMFGIDENTMLAMRGGMGQFGARYGEMAKAIGFNAEHAAAQSNRFMTAMRDLTAQISMARDKIGSNLAGGLAGDIERFRKNIERNWPKIEKVITAVLRGVLALADIVSRMVMRGMEGLGALMNGWDRLDTGTKNIIASFGALLLAWRLLNTAFLTSPLGIILTLAAGLLLLLEDYQTWKEGGQSLIDWAAWEPGIKQALKALEEIRDWIVNGVDAVGGWKTVFIGFAAYIAGSWVLKVLAAFARISKGIAPIVAAMALLSAADNVNDIKGEAERRGIRAGDIIMERMREKEKEGVVFTDRILSGLKGWWVGNFGDAGPAGTYSAYGTRTAETYGPGFTRSPRGIRNNNPGNLRFVGQSGAKSDGSFAIFDNAYAGLKALSNQLLRYFDGKTTGRRLQSIEEIINTYAPSSENDTQGYIARVSKMMGISPQAALNLRDPQTMAALMGSITQVENGRNPYGYELTLNAARDSIGPSVSQSTYITVNGSTNPQETAYAIADRQVDVNARLTQQAEKVMR